MEVIVKPEAAAAALNRIVRGNTQAAIDAWAAIEPKLRGFTAALETALRAGDVEVMAFEYKRVEAFNRGIGALLNRIDAALADLDAVADDAALAPVHARAAAHVHGLGAMKKTLTRRLQEVNRLQAGAARAIDAGRRAQGAFDADWERVQDRIVRALDEAEKLKARVDRVRKDMNASRLIDEGVVERIEAAAGEVVQAMWALGLRKLKEEVGRIGDSTVVESSSKDFAVQFRKERGKVDEQLERIERIKHYAESTARELQGIRIALRK